MFDAARFVAAIGIVWIHCFPNDGPNAKFAFLGTFADVGFFVVASLFLLGRGMQRSPHRTLGEYASNRFVRLYVPMLIWTAIYLGIRLLKHRFVAGGSDIGLNPPLLLGGAANNLWFLPYLLFIGIIAFVLLPLLSRRRETAYGGVGFLLTSGFILGVAPPPPWTLLTQGLGNASGQVAFLLDRYWHFMPSALWGMAFALAYPSLPLRWWQGKRAALVGVALSVLWIVIALITTRTNGAGDIPGWHGSLFHNLAGLGWLLIALSTARPRWATQLAALGPLAFGIYLNHVLIVEGIKTIALRAHLAESLPLDIATFAISVPLSVALAWAFSKTKWSALLAPA